MYVVHGEGNVRIVCVRGPQISCARGKGSLHREQSLTAQHGSWAHGRYELYWAVRVLGKQQVNVLRRGIHTYIVPPVCVLVGMLLYVGLGVQ